MNPISKEIRTGTIGELLVALRLLQYGVQAAPPIKDSGNDLIAVKGEVFRAIQVKTTQSPAFSLYRLRKRLFHIVALVQLVGEGHSINLEESRIFLLEKSRIDQNKYKIEELGEYLMNENLVNTLFDIESGVEALPASSVLTAAQRVVEPQRNQLVSPPQDLDV